MPPEQAKLVGFVERVTTLYGAPRLQVVIVEDNRGADIYYHLAEIRVARRVLAFRDYEPLLAHELGHHLLGHRGQDAVKEMQANAKAVEILARLNGGDEALAFRRIHAWLVRGHERGTRADGHLSPCQEIAALDAAYLQHRVYWASKACAP